MPGVGTAGPLLMVDARESDIYGALVANNTSVPGRLEPITLTLTAAFTATTTATAATNTASAAPTIAIRAGTPLQFKDAAGSYIAIVGTDSATGAGIEITAAEDIPNGAIAEWPVRLDLVTDHTQGVQTTLNNVSTYDHIGSGESARADTTRTFSSTANVSPYSAGQRLLNRAANQELDIYLEVRDPNPDATVFATPPLSFGIARMSDASVSGTNGQKLSRTYSATYSGTVTELDAAV